MPCISIQYNISIGPIINVVIALPGVVKQVTDVMPPDKAVGPVPLLIDTGADITCISPDIAKQLNLRPSGKRPVGVPSGAATLNTYIVDIVVPFGDPTKGAMSIVEDSITVMEFLGNNQNYKGLLGRDIICKGTLNMMWDGRVIFCL